MADICWVHVGDLHASADDDWQSLRRLEAIVREVNERVGSSADFAFVPGDIANHGAAAEYARLVPILDSLRVPWRAVPGDHDFEPGNLDAFCDSIPQACRPESESVGGYRCMFFDVVSSGGGGPDFRISPHHRGRLAETLAHSAAVGEIPLAFMHAYPGDLAVDSDGVAASLIDGRVLMVDTGHTHYNELLNDGRTIYASTRSTGQIEEDGGRCGYSIVCAHERVPSWRFRRLGQAWPHVQIVSPCDVRLVTQPSDAAQVPRLGTVVTIARVIGAARGLVPVVSAGDASPTIMQRVGEDLWQGAVDLGSPGVHAVTVTCGDGSDSINVLARSEREIPKRAMPVAAGHACNAIGAWPAAGIDGLQLGPNKNGRTW